MRRRILLLLALVGSAAGCGKSDRQPVGETSANPVVAPPPARVDGPTDAECEAAVKRIAAVVPGVAGDAVDKQDCMLMPREVVVCMANASSEAEADACAEKYAASRPKVVGTEPTKVGPPPDEAHASEADCRAAVANVRTLVPKMEGNDDEMVRDCAATASVEEVKCLMGAKTMEELDACDPTSGSE